jgi:hypothetical protein
LVYLFTCWTRYFALLIAISGVFGAQGAFIAVPVLVGMVLGFISQKDILTW